MVILNRIYTRTGDDGTSGLSTGERRAKDDVRFEAIGAVDEANASIGVARLHCAGLPDLEAMLARIQNDLFDLGADLATPEGAALTWEPLRLSPGQVAWLEARIDGMNARLQPLRSFILPGGSAAATHLHVARTSVRRAERRVVALMRLEPEGVSRPVAQYLNRLSDLLFVAGRVANSDGAADVLWVPGRDR